MKTIPFFSLSIPLLAQLATLLTSTIVFADEPLRIGSEKQLFIGPFDEGGRDTYLVESMKNVTMTMNPARVTGERLLELDKPWERGEWPLLDMRQFVLKDGNRFRMYYSALSKYPKLWSEPNCRILCYAESTDGLHWTKPDLGLVKWNGTRKNNILLPNDQFDYVFSEIDGACVFIDPNAAGPQDRYKMLAKVSPVPGNVKKLPKGQYLFASPDGIHWALFSQKKINPRSSDTQFSLFFDDSIDKFVAYTRIKFRPKEHAADFRRQFGSELQPQTLQVGRIVSDDLHYWGKEITVMAQDEADLVGSPPGFDRMHFHGGNVSKYSEAPGVYIAMPNAYYRWKMDMSRERRVASGRKHVQLPGTMDVQLLTSRNGIDWNRTPKRRPFIRLGCEGTFWSKTIWPDGNIIRVGDELWIYFAGLDVSHHEQGLIHDHGARGRAVLRLDGFISADAAYTGGELTTVPVVFAGSALRLNVDTGAGGTVLVEIQDEAGNPVEGFSTDDADEINGNYTRKLVTWNQSSDVSSLTGRAIRLRFVMRDTKLYSFQFTTKEAK